MGLENKNTNEVQRGYRPKLYIADELEYLKIYTPEQLKKLWEDIYPKLNGDFSDVIVTGTPK